MKGAILFCTIMVFIAHGFKLHDSNAYESNQDILVDESSFSNINEVRTESFNLLIDLDFEQNLIYGYQTLNFRTVKSGVSRVALDVRDLGIVSVFDDNQKIRQFKVISGIDDELGQKLEIDIDEKNLNDKFSLTIRYVTSKNPSAVSWLTKEQTAGKKMPYLYTQCESIHCRSIAPLQDTPGVKSTYTLSFISPAEIIVRATGNLTEEYVSNSKRHTSFSMSRPVPSYLLAFAAGNLEEKQLGERTYVITEPELIDISAQELSRLEEALQTVENYMAPYDWGDYKILMLPPSFPYGGMENPLLTFANSGLITGDGAAFRIFVHELCHSWFGNNITNDNWSNFWLKEGFTVFLERKIDSFLFGVDSSKVAGKLGNSSLYLTIKTMGENNNYTSLYPRLNGNHPDTSFSGVPYEKGYQFLTYLESLIGEDNFQEFLRSYSNHFGTLSLDVQDFIDFFIKFIQEKYEEESVSILSLINWRAWVYQPGYPPEKVDLETKEFDQAVSIAHHYINEEYDPSDIEVYKKFDLVLKSVVMVEFLSANPILSIEKVSRIDQDLETSKETYRGFENSWLILGISTGYLQSPFETADKYLGSIGRDEFVTPIYAEIIKKDRDIAWKIFQNHYSFYHPITRNSISNLFEADEILEYPIISTTY